MDSPSPAVTAADLERHRIGQLEKQATEQSALLRGLEREVDRLKIETAAVIAGLARLEGKLDERDTHLQASLSRLHERLDERIAGVSEEVRAELTKAREAELIEEGEKRATRRLWKAWLSITMAAVGVGGVIVAIIALFVH